MVSVQEVLEDSKLCWKNKMTQGYIDTHVHEETDADTNRVHEPVLGNSRNLPGRRQLGGHRKQEEHRRLEAHTRAPL